MRPAESLHLHRRQHVFNSTSPLYMGWTAPALNMYAQNGVTSVLRYLHIQQLSASALPVIASVS